MTESCDPGQPDRDVVGGYFNWAGTPAPSPLNWYPELGGRNVHRCKMQAAWSVYRKL
ncbi:MAG: hypothetical protein V9E85_05545 [Candidatus Nanopelagicales bacterium]